jgi:phosphosulfolactate synthase (CoM biosynthesis protein A)
MDADRTAAIGFLRLAPRALKPRLRGVTAVRGPRLGAFVREELADLFAAMGDWTDVLRLGDASPVPVPPKALAAFVETAHLHQVTVARTGLETVLPMGARAIERYLDGTRALGFDAVVLPACDEIEEDAMLKLDHEVLKRGLLPHPELSTLH